MRNNIVRHIDYLIVFVNNRNEIHMDFILLNQHIYMLNEDHFLKLILIVDLNLKMNKEEQLNLNNQIDIHIIHLVDDQIHFLRIFSQHRTQYIIIFRSNSTIVKHLFKNDFDDFFSVRILMVI